MKKGITFSAFLLATHYFLPLGCNSESLKNNLFFHLKGLSYFLVITLFRESGSLLPRLIAQWVVFHFCETVRLHTGLCSMWKITKVHTNINILLINFVRDSYFHICIKGYAKDFYRGVPLRNTVVWIAGSFTPHFGRVNCTSVRS